MPAKAQWLLRIPAIIDALAAVSVPVVDRTAVERLFGVGRRRAIDLMRLFEGYQTGSAFLLDRLSLIETLRRIAADPNIDYERRRRERLSAELDSARRLQVASRVRIAVRPGVQRMRSAGGHRSSEWPADDRFHRRRPASVAAVRTGAGRGI